MTTSPEMWRPVGTHPHYEVSSHGRLRRIACNGITAAAPRYNGGTVQKSGHIAVNLSPAPLRRTHMHVLVAEAFLGPKPTPQSVVLHWDDVPANNHVENLRWGTRADNHKDAMRNGRMVAGAYQTVKTHCPRGHELEAPNLSPAHLKYGARQCLACHRAMGGGWGTAVRARGARPTDDPRFKARADAEYAAIMRGV